MKKLIAAINMALDSKNMLVGSPSLIASLTELDLIDGYQLCTHPVILGSGLPLFKNITNRNVLRLVRAKTFGSGTIAIYYRNGLVPINEKFLSGKK